MSSLKKPSEMQFKEIPILKKIKDFFDNLFKSPSPNISDNGGEKEEILPKIEREENPAKEYIQSLIPEKTFDQWLGEQGLSRNSGDENYFGKNFQDRLDALLSQSYTDKQYEIDRAKKKSLNNSLIAQNNYLKNNSNFSSSSEHMYDIGLKNSGFDNYLKGITYLAYRDEINNNNLMLQDSLEDIESRYVKRVMEGKEKYSENIEEKEQTLLKLYLDEINKNKSLVSKLI